MTGTMRANAENEKALKDSLASLDNWQTLC